MYNAYLEINNKKYKGTLTFFILKEIQEDLLKEFNRSLTICDIIESLENEDMEVLIIFLLKSTGKNLLDDFEKADIYEKFNNAYKYINELLHACIPSISKKNTNNDFEDMPDHIVDWEFDWMEYMWTTTLNRNDFWNITPKNFFEQLDIYKKINNIEDTNIEEI